MRGSTWARVPFSIVAVLLLGISGTAVVYLEVVDRETRDLREARVAAALDQAATAEGIIAGSIRQGTRSALASVYSGPDPSPDRIAGLVRASVEGIFPLADGQWETRLAIDDLTWTYDLRDGDETDPIGNSSTVPIGLLVTLTGTIETSEAGETIIRRPLRLSESVVSSLPLQDLLAGEIQARSLGPGSDLGTMVGAMLTRLIQVRIMQGYGAGLEPTRTTALILSEDDVVLALDVALRWQRSRVLGEMAVKDLPAPLAQNRFGTVVPGDAYLVIHPATDELEPGVILAQVLSGVGNAAIGPFIDLLPEIPQWATSAIGKLVAIGSLILPDSDPSDADLLAVSDLLDGIIRTGGGRSELQGQALHNGADAIDLRTRSYRYVDMSGANRTLRVGGHIDNLARGFDLRGDPGWSPLLEDDILFSGDLEADLQRLIRGWAARLMTGSPFADGFLTGITDPRNALVDFRVAITPAALLALAPGDLLLTGSLAGNLSEIKVQSLDLIGTPSQGLLPTEDEFIAVAEPRVLSGLRDQVYDAIRDAANLTERNRIQDLVQADFTTDLFGVVADLLPVAYTAAVKADIDEWTSAFYPQATRSTSDWVGYLLEMLILGFPGFPGLSALILDSLGTLTDRLTAANRFLAADDPVPVVGPRSFDAARLGFELNLTDPAGVGMGPAPIVHILAPTDHTDNTRFDDPGDPRAAPFEAHWFVNITRTYQLSFTGSEVGAGSLPPGIDTEVTIDLVLDLPGSSGWALDGVSYRSDFDLIDAALDLLDAVWEEIGSWLEPIMDLTRSVTTFLSDLRETLMTLGTRLLGYLSDHLKGLMVLTEEWLTALADAGIITVLEALRSVLTDRVWVVSLLGFTLEVAVRDRLGPAGDDEYLTFAISGHGLDLTGTLSANESGSPNLRMTLGFAVAGVAVTADLDARRWYQESILHLTATGEAFQVDLSAPVVVDEEVFEVRLSDFIALKAILGNIPLPPTPLKAAVDAGFRVVHGPPTFDHPAITEVEANPEGRDSGSEWVELYNPSPLAIDLTGWHLETTHGRNARLDLDQILLPGEYLQVTFPKQAIDNEQERVLLFGPEGGAPVDETPLLNDRDNDDITWQRRYVAGPFWDRLPGTPGSGPDPADFDLLGAIRELAMDAIQTAGARLLGTDAPTLDEVISVLQDTVSGFIQAVIGLLEVVVREVELWVEAFVTDASGSGGAGVHLGVVLDGSALGAFFAYLWEVVIGLGRALVAPATASGIGLPPPALLAAISLRIVGIVEVEVPASVPGEPPLQIETRFQIEPNLPALLGGAFGTRDLWEIRFGAYLPEVDGDLYTWLGTEPGTEPDLWIISGTVGPVSA